MSGAPLRLGILGGCFNPVHAGHVRLALESLERLGLDRVDLVPCHTPPHRSDEAFLDFTLRAHLARLAVRGLDRLRVDLLEADLDKPSYTLHTLRALRARQENVEPYFLMGAVDLPSLPQWHRSAELMQLTHFVVAPRAGEGPETVRAVVAQAWPGLAKPEAPPQGAALAWRLEHASGTATRLLVLEAPSLEISASALRDLWRQGRSLRCLVPEAVELALLDRREEVEAAWGPRLDRHAHRL